MQIALLRRLLILVAGGLVLILLASQFSPSDPTREDYPGITRAVARRTTRPITSIIPLPSGAVRVWTRRDGKLQNDSLELQKIFGLWCVYSHQHHALRVKKGISARPQDPMELAGSFSQSGFTEAVILTLSSNGTYTAQWEADIGNGGEASGTWSLQGTNVVLTPLIETRMMKDYLRTLDVYQYENNWILVAPRARRNYNRLGITRQQLFHFQKSDHVINEYTEDGAVYATLDGKDYMEGQYTQEFLDRISQHE